MAAPTPPASQPAFATRRLLLTPRTSADNESCLEMDSDPEVIRFIAVPWTDAAEHKAFIAARTRGPYRAILDHAFGALELAEVIADIHPENAENIGLVLRGRRFHHGEPHLHYAITAAEYRAPDDQA